jgi:hypothetical protein
MAKISGVNGKVMYGSVVVANMVSWSMSGFNLPVTAAPTAFGDTGTQGLRSRGLGEAGTRLSSTGIMTRRTPQGSMLLRQLSAGTTYQSVSLCQHLNILGEWGAGGYIIVTKANAVTLPRNNFGTISFSGQVSSRQWSKIRKRS